MNIEEINLGRSPTGAGGDSIRTAFTKVNNALKLLVSTLSEKLGKTESALSAKKLTTPFKINGVDVDGSGDVEIGGVIRTYKQTKVLTGVTYTNDKTYDIHVQINVRLQSSNMGNIRVNTGSGFVYAAVFNLAQSAAGFYVVSAEAWIPAGARWEIGGFGASYGTSFDCREYS